MTHVLKHFSIVDITHHAEIGSLTGKVKFQFEDSVRPDANMGHYVTVDVAVPADDNDTLRHIHDSLLAQAIAVLHATLAEAAHADGRPSFKGGAIKSH